jgi:hypothetical protein
MLFRPTFCAHCGERIERTEWRIWTSRRFCYGCESEFKGQDLIPRAVVILGILIGILGVGGYIKSGPASDMRVAREPQRFVSKQEAPQQSPILRQDVPPPALAANVPPLQGQILASPTAPPAPVYVQPPQYAPRVEQVEAVHYCGAETKKGTPCARRVKGNTRCYQHVGMPAMALAVPGKIK